MNNLMDAIDNSLKKINLEPISDKVNNRESCYKYINDILNKYGYKVDIPHKISDHKYDYRIKHVLFSFGLGLVLFPFLNLGSLIQTKYGEKYRLKDAFIYTWLTLCLYHDYGYFISDEYFKCSDLAMLNLTYDIFSDGLIHSRYSRDLYYCYYRRQYVMNNATSKNGNNDSKNEEVGDHGILGGYVLFDRICSSKQTSKKNTKRMETKQNPETSYSSDRVPLYKDISFRIMEHNIWKINEKYEDSNPLQEIDINHFPIITQNEALLCLLSLVDTIEMTKKFCKYEDNNEDKERFVYPNTLGKKVTINISDTFIEINYSQLKKLIESKKFINNIEGWINSVITLNNWVDVDTLHIEKESKIIITPKMSY